MILRLTAIRTGESSGLGKAKFSIGGAPPLSLLPSFSVAHAMVCLPTFPFLKTSHLSPLACDSRNGVTFVGILKLRPNFSRESFGSRSQIFAAVGLEFVRSC